jgi:DNA-binding transcriptional MocR family regulator
LRERNRRRRGLGLAAIESSFPTGTRVTHPQGGYMLWAELPRLIDLAELRTRARAERIVFAAGDVFFAAKPDRSYLRLNCAKASEADLTSGLEKLGALLQTGA